ncbi:MAG: gfo/Idh/MocA family oxidoreductase, partial [Nitrospiraceae bacterium]|nr:gfo/Idh/MocA family oxidoreductase [Nitrospiraceae bacterium]
LASTGEAPGTDRLEIAGDRGRLVFEDGTLSFKRNEVGTKEFTETAKGGFDRPETWDCTIPIDQGGSDHKVITQNFIDAILDGVPLLAPAPEGIRSVELANAMIYSSLIGDTVELPLDGEAYEAKLQQLIAESRFEKKTNAGGEMDYDKSYR